MPVPPWLAHRVEEPEQALHYPQQEKVFVMRVVCWLFQLFCRGSRLLRGKVNGEVYENSLGMRHFLIFHYSEEARLAPSWAAGVAREARK